MRKRRPQHSLEAASRVATFPGTVTVLSPHVWLTNVLVQELPEEDPPKVCVAIQAADMPNCSTHAHSIAYAEFVSRRRKQMAELQAIESAVIADSEQKTASEAARRRTLLQRVQNELNKPLELFWQIPDPSCGKFLTTSCACVL